MFPESCADQMYLAQALSSFERHLAASAWGADAQDSLICSPAIRWFPSGLMFVSAVDFQMKLKSWSRFVWPSLLDQKFAETLWSSQQKVSKEISKLNFRTWDAECFGLLQKLDLKTSSLDLFGHGTDPTWQEEAPLFQSWLVQLLINLHCLKSAEIHFLSNFSFLREAISCRHQEPGVPDSPPSKRLKAETPGDLQSLRSSATPQKAKDVAAAGSEASDDWITVDDEPVDQSPGPSENVDLNTSTKRTPDAFEEWCQSSLGCMDQKELTILLLGQTGSGKSSFLNLLGNFPTVLRHGNTAVESEMKDFRDLTFETDMKDKTVSWNHLGTLL